MKFTALDFQLTLPLLFLASWACLVLLVDVWLPARHKAYTWALSMVGIAITTFLLSIQNTGATTAFGGMVRVDGLSVAFSLLFLSVGWIGTLLARDYLERNQETRGEFYSLLLFSVAGMVAMAMANDLIVVFLAIELLSIPLYVLSGYFRTRSDSEESALKYFLLGAFSSAFLVYGIAFIYGALATTNFDHIASALTNASANPTLYLYIGVGLVLVGLGFKVAAVPFHAWVPDVYEGAPSVVTAFMSVAAKAAGFVALIRVLFGALSAIAPDWALLIAILAAATMILGNITALQQTSLKRMLAYSSIAQAGYMLMAGVAGGLGKTTDFAASSMLFYLIAYAFTNLGAWSVLLALEKQMGIGNNIADFAGLAKKHPILASAMTLFLLSLTGLPLTIGFVGKFYVFSVTLQAGYTWLAIVGVITSLISAYYYLRVVVVMWMQSGEPEVNLSPSLRLTLWIAAVGTLGFGLLPAPLMQFVERAVGGLFLR